MGVLRRHPDGKWNKSEDVFKKITLLQRDLLKHALTHLKVGGELVFSVCSFEHEETLMHLNWLLNIFGDKIEVVNPVKRLPDTFKKYVTKDHVFLSLPGNKENMDGFGAFCIKKCKELDA